MDDRHTPIAPSPLSIPDAAGRATADPSPAKDFQDVILHEEVEVWVNEGGAGDEPALRILLVEDDANIRAVLAETLESLGHSVCSTAATENEAVAAAGLCKPDLMIVDIRLAAGSGVVAVARVLQTAHVPHFFMSGFLPEYVADGVPVLKKPFRAADLALWIEAALALSRRNVTPPLGLPNDLDFGPEPLDRVMHRDRG